MPKFSGRIKGSKVTIGTDSGIYDLADSIENPTIVNQGLYSFTDATFTPGGKTGRSGPSLATARSGLSGTDIILWKNNTEYFNTSSGIQLWKVPVDGTYRIEVAGAKGGPSAGSSASGGDGAKMRGDFVLTSGDVIKILVGQEGLISSGSNGSGGGGGGSFVVDDQNNALIIAGGGGGGADGSSSIDRSGTPGTTSNSGTSGRDGNRDGGAEGVGGEGTTGAWGGGGGGGLTGNGGPAKQSGSNISGSGGVAFTSGGGGGNTTSRTYPYGNDGGFGGGGGSSWGAGGGGGYSGGAADESFGSGSDKEGGGGGGSFNAGSNQSNTGTNNGPGFVTITLL